MWVVLDFVGLFCLVGCLFFLTNSELFTQDEKFIFKLLKTLMSFSHWTAHLATLLILSESLACPQFTSVAVSLQGTFQHFHQL